MEENKLPEGLAPAGEPSAPSESKKCSRCGTPFMPGTRFCFECGARLGQTDEALPGPAPARPPVTAPPPRKPFEASWREIVAAVATYVLAWWYLYRSELFLCGAFCEDGVSWLSVSPLRVRIWTLVFVLGFVALAELIHWRTKRPGESWIWLGCMAVITAGMLLGRNRVWEDYPSFFLHLAAVYWLLCRSGRLAEGVSGHLLPVDGLRAFIIFPFKHFYLRIKTLFWSASRLFRNRRKPKAATLLWSGLALLAAALLFVIATSLLMDADRGFSRLLSGIGKWFRIDWNGELFTKFLLSLPVGQYLFGLLAGTGREDPERLRERAGGFCRWLERLRRVPNPVWTALTGAFCLLYLVFFAVQSRYLFGAFTRSLPEGFIVSRYAREGFFELCKVMAVNFVLLWLVTRVSRVPVRENRPTLILCLVLLMESMLFAVVAFSKLALYIDCFGFTPLRLQSSWLVCVLFAGCLAAGWTLLTGKKSFRVWLVFSAVSLSLLCLY
jgi:hypothetical protein